ncbi:1112_t:CDS:1, partial [Gigaspora margarita]
INEFKEILVYNIQKKLSNNSNSAGPQSITIPCTESQFVAVFGGHITWYSITKRSYECSFSGQNAYNILCRILGDENWGIRHYSQGQQTAVILVAPPTTNPNESETNNINSQKRCKKFSRFEFSVQWIQQQIKDTNGHVSQAGFLIMRFITDVGYF